MRWQLVRISSRPRRWTVPCPLELPRKLTHHTLLTHHALFAHPVHCTPGRSHSLGMFLYMRGAGHHHSRLRPLWVPTALVRSSLFPLSGETTWGSPSSLGFCLPGLWFCCGFFEAFKRVPRLYPPLRNPSPQGELEKLETFLYLFSFPPKILSTFSFWVFLVPFFVIFFNNWHYFYSVPLQSDSQWVLRALHYKRCQTATFLL